MIDNSSAMQAQASLSVKSGDCHVKNGELSVLQKAFIEHFAFQCGYCTAGFLNEGQVLLERLERKPVARADLEKTIAEALDGHLCRPPAPWCCDQRI